VGDLDRRGAELARKKRSLKMSGNQHLVTGLHRSLRQSQ
jgi:hypothetical protein